MTKVRKIADGEIITEPGCYDMSIGWYHQQCCDGPSISSSGIRAMLHSPAEYWRTSSLNPNRVEDPPKEAFVLGRAAHHLLLGERDFFRHFIVQPETYPSSKTGEQVKWIGSATFCKEWKADQIEKGLTILTASQIEQVRGMAGLLPWQAGMTNCGLSNTALVAEHGVLSGEIERSLVFKIGNVWVKSRPDAIPGDSNDFADLKTISPKSAAGIDDRSLSLAVHEHQYFVQGAVVGMAAKEVLDRQMAGFHLVFVDTGNVHAVSIKTLDEQDIIRGERALFAALQAFERCIQSGIWPGPTARQTDAQKLGIPDWGRQQFDQQLDTMEKEFA